MRIVALTSSERAKLAKLGRTTTGMAARAELNAGLRTAMTDERAAAAATGRGDRRAFTAAFDRLIQHGHPTGPDYRGLLLAGEAAAKIFPFKVWTSGPPTRPGRRPAGPVRKTMPGCSSISIPSAT